MQTKVAIAALPLVEKRILDATKAGKATTTTSMKMLIAPIAKSAASFPVHCPGATPVQLFWIGLQANTVLNKDASPYAMDAIAIE